MTANLFPLTKVVVVLQGPCPIFVTAR
jgi:hypothetical protein